MGLRGGWGACSMKLTSNYMDNTNKTQANKKRLWERSDSETKEKPNYFLSFIVMESAEEIPLSKLSPFKL